MYSSSQVILKFSQSARGHFVMLIEVGMHLISSTILCEHVCCCKNCKRIMFKFDINLLWVKDIFLCSLSSWLKGIWYC